MSLVDVAILDLPPLTSLLLPLFLFANAANADSRGAGSIW